MSALTKEQIAALPVLVAKATPGPWRVEQGTTLIWGHCNPDDASNRGMGYPVSECRITPISSWAKGPDVDEGEGNASLIAVAPSLAATVIEQQAEIERLRGFIADFSGNRFERIERRAHDPQDDLDPVTDWNAIDAWQDDARAVLEVKP